MIYRRKMYVYEFNAIGKTLYNICRGKVQTSNVTFIFYKMKILTIRLLRLLDRKKKKKL